MTLPSLPTWAGVALLVALPIAVGVGLLVRARLRRARTPRNRSQQACTLAELGLAPAEVARRTGLSRDAVALALSVGAAEAARQNPPRAARTAGNNAPAAAVPAIGTFAQVFARKRLEAAA